MLWKICLELDGIFPWSKVECVNNNLTANNICDDGVHPNASGIQLLVENLRFFFLKKVLPFPIQVKPRKIVGKT